MSVPIVSGFEVLRLRVRLRVFVSGRGSSLVARRMWSCGRYAPVCASGDRRRNVVCVAWCAEVRSLPARPIKSGCFPLTMSTANNCWSSLSVC